ncbi:hypothetical protein T484DRAFT_1623177, partial [Baffinella frigidus]
AEPRLTEPRLTEPRLTEPRLSEPRLSEPRLTEPRLTEAEPARGSECQQPASPPNPKPQTLTPKPSIGAGKQAHPLRRHPKVDGGPPD